MVAGMPHAYIAGRAKFKVAGIRPSHKSGDLPIIILLQGMGLSDCQANPALGRSELAGIGTVIAYWGMNDPKPSESEGETWLLCDGREVKRKEYPELHALVGEIFGAGDNITTFNLPDLRGRFIRGLDWGPNPDPKHSGEGPVSSGRDPDLKDRTSMGTGKVTDEPVVGSLQPCALQLHAHPITGALEITGFIQQQPIQIFLQAGGVTSGWFGPTEEEGGKETRPYNMYVNYLIRAV